MATKNFQFMVDPHPDVSGLRQGDVLVRNEALASALGAAHEYYSTAEGYDYFIVLTPTCQMIKRNGSYSARYITLAAIRPFQIYIEREFSKFQKKINSVDGVVLKKDKEILARQQIERLLHNTQDGYLFLPSEFFPDSRDRIAFLLLSVAIRTREHYDACLSAKFLQLSDSFSAKVGNLTSDLYGQIATEALEEQTGVNASEVIDEYIERYINSENNYWLSDERISRLKVSAKRFVKANGSPVPRDQLPEFVAKIPTDGEILAERILDMAAKSEIARKNASKKKKDHFANELLSDPIIKRVAKI